MSFPEKRGRVSIEKKKKQQKSSETRRSNAFIPLEYFIFSSLPDRDMEEFAITTVHTIEDYVHMDVSGPRDQQFVEKLHAALIPKRQQFEGMPEAITEFLHDVASHQEDPSYQYALSRLVTTTDESFLIFQLRQRFSIPARIVVLPTKTRQRTYGVFTTEKTLPLIQQKGIKAFFVPQNSNEEAADYS